MSTKKKPLPMEYRLDNIEDRHAEAPATFQIPTKAERISLKAGDIVKLIFRFNPVAGGPEAERMWVRVTARKGARYQGTLANNPAFIEGLHHGDPVEFGPEHVASIYED